MKTENQTPYDKHFEYRENLMDIAPRFFLRTGLMLDFLEDEKGSLIDVGCGDGYFLKKLAEAGYDCTGIDVSAEAVKRAKRVLKHYPDCDVMCKGIEEIDRNKDFKIAICGETLEHVKNDTEFLKSIYKLLKPKGTLVLSVPVDKSLWDHHDEEAGHFRRYSKKEIFKKIRKAGFKVEDYVIWGFPIVRTMQTFIRRGQKQMMQKEDNNPRQFLVHLKPILKIAKYVFLFDNLFNFTEKGVGIIIKTKKKDSTQ